MKIILYLLFFAVCTITSCNKIPSKSVAKQGLQKISWIEGNWYGLYKGKPFYEIYKLTNDTTLSITSYEWNGTDSSKTSRSFVYKKNGDYYLGDSLDWKVKSITDTSILMQPNYKASNYIVWKIRDKDGWDAILEHKSGVTVYNMKRADHFTK